MAGGGHENAARRGRRFGIARKGRTARSAAAGRPHPDGDGPKGRLRRERIHKPAGGFDEGLQGASEGSGLGLCGHAERLLRKFDRIASG